MSQRSLRDCPRIQAALTGPLLQYIPDTGGARSAIRADRPLDHLNTRRLEIADRPNRPPVSASSLRPGWHNHHQIARIPTDRLPTPVVNYRRSAAKLLPRLTLTCEVSIVHLSGIMW